MLIEYFIITLSIFGVSYAGDNNYISYKDGGGAPCQTEKLCVELSDLKSIILRGNEEILANIETMKNNSDKKMDILEKKLSYLENKIVELELVVRNQTLQNIDEKLNGMQKQIPDMQQNITTGLQDLEKMNTAVLTKLDKLPESWRCREEVVIGYGYKNFYPLNSLIFNHVTYRKYSNGSVNFEMHFGIKAASDGHILLSSAPSAESQHIIHEIVIGSSSNMRTVLRNEKKTDIEIIQTPNILFATKFTDFHLKIDNEHMELRKGNETLLSRDNDARLKEVQYFSFASWNNEKGTIYYDCCC